jgi:hypothetical protein
MSLHPLSAPTMIMNDVYDDDIDTTLIAMTVVFIGLLIGNGNGFDIDYLKIAIACKG